MRFATSVTARAIRRAGEWLKQIEPAKPGPKAEIGMGAHTQLDRLAAGERAGMSKHQQVQAIRVANVPSNDFDCRVESAISGQCSPGNIPHPIHPCKLDPLVSALSS
jgi:hypothetical protein